MLSQYVRLCRHSTYIVRTYVCMYVPVQLLVCICMVSRWKNILHTCGTQATKQQLGPTPSIRPRPRSLCDDVYMNTCKVPSLTASCTFAPRENGIIAISLGPLNELRNQRIYIYIHKDVCINKYIITDRYPCMYMSICWIHGRVLEQKNARNSQKNSCEGVSDKRAWFQAHL